MSKEFYTSERCYITELVNDPTQPAASLARCRVTPGTLTQKHRLSVAEWYVILAGDGEMSLGDAPAFPVTRDDVVAIPAHTAQQIRNTGAADLIFHCLCVPAFTPNCYQNLEDDAAAS